METDIDHGSPVQAADAAQAEDQVATGDPRVDAALGRLDALGNLLVSEHPPIFERVHGQLVEVLGELRADPDSTPGALGGWPEGRG